MRLSKKVVLEYLESVYPEWKNFEQIVEELPVMFNFDMFELQDRLDKLRDEGKVEADFPSRKDCLGERQRYRTNRK